jgi:hypothetical protein
MTCIEHEKENILFGLEHGKGSELLDNQQRASRDDAKKNIFFLMLNAGHPVCRSPDTSRTLFLLASTQGVSCRLVMNYLIYMYMFSLTPPPLIYI